MERLINRLVVAMANKQIIEKSKNAIECYTYGLTMIVTTLLVFVAMLLCALFQDLCAECFVFAVAFCPLRAMSGGYHCKRFVSCFFLSLSYWMILALLIWFEFYVYTIPIIVAMVGSCGYIVCKAPIVRADTLLEQDEIAVIRRKMIIILVVQLIIFVLSICFSIELLSLILCYSAVLVALLMLVVKIGGV